MRGKEMVKHTYWNNKINKKIFCFYQKERERRRENHFETFFSSKATIIMIFSFLVTPDFRNYHYLNLVLQII